MNFEYNGVIYNLDLDNHTATVQGRANDDVVDIKIVGSIEYNS